MATTPPTQDPNQGGSPQGGSPDPSSSGMNAPASPELMMLSKMTMALQQMAQSKPETASGLQKAIQGINEAQSALVTGPQANNPSSTPPY